MRKEVLFLALLLALASCGHSNKKGESLSAENEVDSTAVEADLTAEVAARITAIYDEVFGSYRAQTENAWPVEDFDREGFLSKDYLRLQAQVLRADSLAGELGFFDYDHWIQAQDWGSDLAMQLVGTEMQSDSTALCHIIVLNCGYKTPFTIAMVKEDGRWLIDDFINDPADDLSVSSEKEQMKEYLKQ